MNFQQFLHVLLARKWIALSVLATVVLSAAAVSVLMPKQYTADAALTIDVKASDPITGMPVQGYLANGFMATQVDIIASQNGALRVVTALDLLDRPEVRERWLAATNGRGEMRDWLAAALLKGLEVKPSRESNTIGLEYTAADPKFAAILANEFAAAYIRGVADMRAAAAQQNNAFFEQQLKLLKGNLEKAQQQLSSYQQAQGIVASDERLDVETQRLNELGSQAAQAQGAALDAQSRTKGGAQAPDVLNNPLIQQLKNQLAIQQGKLDEAAQKYGPNHPHYLQAKAELDATRSQLNQLLAQYAGGLHSAAGNADSRQAAMVAALQAQKARVLELKSQRSHLDVLQREVDSAQRAYDQALQRLSQTALESRATQTNIAMLKTAVEPLRPSSPKLLLNLLLALFVGSVLGIAFAMLAELFDRRVRSATDVETLLDLPVLAVLGQAPVKRGRFGFRKLATAA
ncbi:chain length determinant protein EpsF [Jeongeupia chitinilytica]|uniref:Chain length determinant protein EpsF n=1 Tax=Jeongeupia chitinilytica TaxID=1041641 RepID=A0ABQ3GY24_9NEIS|nr:chain length determinant protein EpsF [Jeongeupia chitinilytica]GHD56373.1 hypothetical protein GCM10007350_03320 [Jeongeupia chitinilytica]